MRQGNENSHTKKHWSSKNPLSSFALPKGQTLVCSAYVKNDIASILQIWNK